MVISSPAGSLDPDLGRIVILCEWRDDSVNGLFVWPFVSVALNLCRFALCYLISLFSRPHYCRAFPSFSFPVFVVLEYATSEVPVGTVMDCDRISCGRIGAVVKIRSFFMPVGLVWCNTAMMNLLKSPFRCAKCGWLVLEAGLYNGNSSAKRARLAYLLSPYLLYRLLTNVSKSSA